MRVFLLFFVFAFIFSGTSGCETSNDCSLNGDCISQVCICDTAWSGSPTCDVLAIELTDRLAPGLWIPNITTWGGMSINVDGVWHLFAAQMTNKCPLSSWANNSRTVHGVSLSGNANGPFSASSLDEIAQPFSSNPKIFRAPDGTFLLFSIGSGLWNTTQEVCNSSSSSSSEIIQHHHHSYLPGPDEDGCGLFPGSGASGCGLSLGYSLHVEGPYTFVPLIITDANTSKILDCMHGNPSPWIFSNGSILLAFNGGYCHNYTETIGLAFAPSWKGPWKMFQRDPILINARDGSIHIAEDPMLWASHRGFHLMVHNQYRDGGGSPSLYAHSLDARTWILHDAIDNPGPYNGTVVWNDGSPTSLFDVERPQLIFNLKGEAIWLTNGAAGPYQAMAFTLFRPLKSTSILST
jgi:hypothetical protein